MYIRLLLLMTLVMSNTPITDVNIDVMEQMDSLMEFNDKTQHVFNNGKKIFEIVKDFMEEAEKNILAMRSEIDHIEYGELHAKDISRYHRVKSSLEKVRQELIKLAHKTVTDVGDMIIILDELDDSNDPTLLRLSIDSMKDLMDDTKGRVHDIHIRKVLEIGFLRPKVRTFADASK